MKDLKTLLHEYRRQAEEVVYAEWNATTANTDRERRWWFDERDRRANLRDMIEEMITKKGGEED